MIVEFNPRHKPRPDVWQCRCGSLTFRLYEDGAVQCGECGHEAVTMQGYWRTPSTDAIPEEFAQANVVPFRPREP